MHIHFRDLIPLSSLLAILLIAPARSEASPVAAADSIAAAAGAAPADTLPAQGEMLDEFVVTAQKKLVESDGAKLTYNVSEDPQAQSSPVMDILRKVPGVSVDADDNIRVNGQTNFRIFLNGREDPSIQGDVKNILKSMPASSIKKIEVISDPGAKYEAEGVGGILNIVTYQTQRLAGFLGTANLWIGNGGIGASASARTKVKNVTADLQVSHNDGSVFNRHYRNTSTYEYPDATAPDATASRRTDQHASLGDYKYTGIRLNTSWEPDTLNLFTLTGNIYFNSSDNDFSETTAGFNPAGEKIWSFRRHTDSYAGNYTGGTIQASYQHNFGAEGAHNLVLSYSYSNSGNDRDVRMTSDDEWNYTLPYIYSRSYSKGFSDTHILQADYSNPLRQWITLEAGGKGTLFRNHNHSFTSYGGEDKVMTSPEGSDLRTNQLRDIWAAYLSADLQWKMFKARAGLRYEYTRMGLRYPAENVHDFTSYLNDLVPNASVTYNITDASNLRLAYMMRISRPSLGVLNPYRNVSTEGLVKYGNPDLKSEKMNNVSLSYSNYDHPLSGTVKLNYMHEANMVTDVIFYKDNLVNSTWANLGRWQSLELELNLSWQPLSDLTLSFYNGTCRNWMKADAESVSQSKNFWQAYMNLSVDYKLPCKIRLSAWGGYNTPWQDLQSKGQSFYYYGLGASRSFLKEDALQISLNLSNILPPNRTNGYSQASSDLIYHSSSRYPQWYAGLGVSYRFGGLKAQVKKTAASIENDSEAGGGSKGN